MSSYIDHRAVGVPNFESRIVHSWVADLMRRYKWLYGDPLARMAANTPDLAAWNALGRRKSGAT